MSTEDALEVMYETVPKTRIVLPTQERHELRWLVISFSRLNWDPRRFLGIEERLSMDLIGEDCVPRTLTGQPDVVIADPPEGIVIVDYKTGKGKPTVPRTHVEGEVIEGRKYLSARDNFQLDTYGTLALHAYPSVRYAMLRVFYLRFNIVVEATLYRHEMEHVERELGDIMMMLDTARREGDDSDLWRARPGAHCARQCPVAASCPVPQEQRGRGALASTQDADTAAARWVTVRALGEQLRKQLVTYHEETGYAPKVGDGTEVRWDQPAGKARKFGPHQPATPVPDERLDDVFAQITDGTS